MSYLLHQLLSESAAKYPDQKAIIFRDHHITYSELEKESNKLAHALVTIGVNGGERVGIYMNRCIGSIVGAFGTLKSGATYVPIDPLCPADRLRYIVQKCQVRFLITSQEKLTNIERVFPADAPIANILVMNGLDEGSPSRNGMKVIDWDELREDTKETACQANTIDSDLAYILFTSGSTGQPKGVMLSHLNSLTFINSAHDFFHISTTDRLSNICPLHFDMSVFDIFVACKAGATVVIIPETTAVFPSKLAEFIARNKITVWNSVPSALSLLATSNNLDTYDLTNLRLVLFAGESFPLKYLRQLRETLPDARFCNMYGQTEANTSTYYWVKQLPADACTLPIGKPLPNFDIFALDEDGHLVAEPGQEGELYVRASTVASGYWGEIEKTNRSFVRNPLRQDERVYKTGDLVHLDTDGNYVFVGRKDHMIKSRGYRIEIGEIETALCNHPGIRNAVAVPVPDELIGNRIAVFVVPSAPGQIMKEDLLTYCYQQLPRYMVPEMIEFRDSLPTTSSGKVDRKTLHDEIDSLSRVGSMVPDKAASDHIYSDRM